MCYYGIPNIIKSEKEKDLIYFKKAYYLAKKKYNYIIRNNYIYIFKCRKYLVTNNKISFEKFNQTKDKLFIYYNQCNIDIINPFDLYNNDKF